MTNIRDDFCKALLASLRKRKEDLGYSAKRVYGNLDENDGDAVKTARWVLGLPNEVSDGLEFLWENNRLDLSVQTLVVDPRFKDLFTDEERGQAQATLDYLRETPPPQRR